MVETLQTGSNIVLFSGLQDGDLLLNGSVRSAQDVSVKATGGSITVNSPSIIKGLKLEALAKEASTLRTEVETILRGRVTGSGLVTGQNLTIFETDDVLLTELLTDAGDIEVRAGGAIHLVKVDATKGFDIELAAGDGITSDDTLPDFNVRADRLTVLAGGCISFVSDINSLTADTSSAGDIVVINIAGQLSPILLSHVESFDGRIEITTDGDLRAAEVISATSSAGNTITLRTRELFGGNIMVDRVDAGALGEVLLQAGGFNLGGALTWGGTITSETGGTGRVSARQLTASAGGFAAYPESEVINLRTDVADLVARALTGGDPTNKSIPGSESRAYIVIDELNDIRLRRVETIFGDITVTAGGNIMHQAVRSPNRDIVLDAGGSIGVQLDDALSDGVALLPAKLFGRNLTVTAVNNLTVNTTVDNLVV